MKKKVLVIGSGPIEIGQAAEFDYSGSQACRSLREEGLETILVNSNPATIQSDTDIADKVYIEPLVPEIIEKVIAKEKPNFILATMGGQTGLNLVVQLSEMGVLERYGCETIGTSTAAIMKAEEREQFFALMREIEEPIPMSLRVKTVEDAKRVAAKIGFPVIIRPCYCLGGSGSGIAYNIEELEDKASRGLDLSMVNEINVDECVVGWKEIEYEVMRDGSDNCITICNMENFDPMGVHTGESIVVAPAQTLTDREHQTLRSAAIKIIRALKVEGGCNIQFAIKDGKYYVIEVNPRLSRSSALASKATGYPIARVAAKVALGMRLDEIPNKVTGKTPASFEPTLDYIVTKIPRWPFDKFKDADKAIGTQMKSTGEVMAIGRTFEESLHKAIRSLDTGRYGLGSDGREPCMDEERIRDQLRNPTDQRLYYIRDAFALGMSVDEVHKLTKIDQWFLYKIRDIVEFEELKGKSLQIREAKKLGFSDVQLAFLLHTNEVKIRKLRGEAGVKPVYKIVDTCAAEFEAETPYFYSTYGDECEAIPSKRKKIIIIGGGPIRIGQGIEFDYCTVHAIISLKEEGYETIVINNNPETVSTDFDISDKLYFEPITFEDVMNVIEKEKPDGAIVQFGGQTPINITTKLWRSHVPILGTSPESIDITEDRSRFKALLDGVDIPQAEPGTATSVEGARAVAAKIGYPVLVRPSYVLGGRAMEIVHDEKELDAYMSDAVKVSPDYPILVDDFLEPAIELDVDAVSDGSDVLIGGIMEHIEHAGVHSGDSACVVPPQSLSDETIEKVKEYTIKLARSLRVVGLINIQYAVKDNIVYVLEANPRASRTVPFISKATGIPLAKIGAKLMIGYSLKELGYSSGMPEIPHVAVKEVVIPFNKLPEVDPVLGPEMRSTGEAMGIGDGFGDAFYKAQLGVNMRLARKGNVFVSVKEEDKPDIVFIARELSKMGFNILATDGTKKALSGIEVRRVLKVSEGRPNIVDHMKNGEIDLVINTPSGKKAAKTDGYFIRRTAVELGIPYITTIAGALAAVKAINAHPSEIKSINEYHERCKYQIYK